MSKAIFSLFFILLLSPAGHCRWNPATVLTFQQSAYQKFPPRWVSYQTRNAQGHLRAHRVDLSGVIAEQARKNHLDPLIVSLIIQHESGFKQNAVSPVGARGLMQLMPDTAHDLGISDPLDPIQNVTAGTRYFAGLYRQFGELHRALAAYNAGPGNVTNGALPHFPETRHYAHSIASQYLSMRRQRA